VDYCSACDGGGLDFGTTQMKERGMKAHKGPPFLCRMELLVKIKAQGYCLLLIKTFCVLTELKSLATLLVFYCFQLGAKPSTLSYLSFFFLRKGIYSLLSLLLLLKNNTG
jgi:hypothetical protein